MNHLSYQERGGVTYRCRICGDERVVDEGSEAMIARLLAQIGWGKYPVNGGLAVDYIVLCADHHTAELVEQALAAYGQKKRAGVAEALAVVGR